MVADWVRCLHRTSYHRNLHSGNFRHAGGNLFDLEDLVAFVDIGGLHQDESSDVEVPRILGP